MNCYYCCIWLILVLPGYPLGILAQTPADTTGMQQSNSSADDPSQFITRIEFFNELAHYPNQEYLNQTTFRTIVKLGKRFTTRLDIPYIYNSFTSPEGYKQHGLSDISFRLLGFKLIPSRKSALTISIEIGLNTAASKLVGTGKNLIIPVLSYTRNLVKKGNFVSVLLQQVNSFSGDESRENISYTKIQGFYIRTLSKKMWTVIAPVCYIDYIHGGASMTLEGRIVYAAAPRSNFWVQAGVGLFGDFKLRYQWTVQIAYRYFLFRKMN
ncbi:MAG: hypothetical protein U0W24_15305 [Bacteroidales bacterium]